MRRLHKAAFGLAVAVAAHGAVFFYSAPRLEGLTTVEPEDILINEVRSAPETAPRPAPTSAADARTALDVGWTQPEAAPADERVLTEPKPLSAPPTTKPAVADKPPAKPAATSLPGSAGPVIAADSNYANRVQQHLARYAGALPPGANGEARVQFVVQPDGRVSNVLLVKFSGHTGLDSIALNLPTIAQPLPPPGPIAQKLEVPVQAVAAAP